jgi:hypothetical protein
LEKEGEREREREREKWTFNIGASVRVFLPLASEPNQVNPEHMQLLLGCLQKCRKLDHGGP